MEVASSFIEYVEFNNGQLTVKFKKGSSITYEGVNRAVFDKFIIARSKGQYYHRNIKGQYDVAVDKPLKGFPFASSKEVKGVKYDQSTRELVVFRKDGRVETFTGVDKSAFSGFLTTTDKDRFYINFKKKFNRKGSKPSKTTSLDSFLRHGPRHR
ncbi:MAG: KTSC domain-containing protein [Promethearchaeota archaeon]